MILAKIAMLCNSDYYDLISYGESNPKLVMLILDDPSVPKYLILKYSI